MKILINEDRFKTDKAYRARIKNLKKALKNATHPTPYAHACASYIRKKRRSDVDNNRA